MLCNKENSCFSQVNCTKITMFIVHCYSEALRAVKEFNVLGMSTSTTSNTGFMICEMLSCMKVIKI